MEGTANILGETDPLHEAARFVCEALDFAPNGFAIVRLDGTCVTVNRTLAGWVRPATSVDEVRGFSLLDGDDGKLVAALRRAALGESVIVEVPRVAVLAGRPGPFRLHVMPFRLGGSVQAASVVFEDRCEQALVVAAFEASERRFRLMVGRSSDGIAVHRKGILLYVNPAAVRMFGCNSAEDVIGCSVLDFVHPDRRQEASETLNRLLDGREASSPQRILVGRDGAGLLVEVSVSRSSADDTLSSFLFMREVSPGQAERSARPTAEEQPTPAGASPSVLICDDEQRLAMLTAELLGQYGFQARTASSVDETIAALEQNGRDFGALLLDVNLPHGSARRVLERMQQIGCGAPVILTSGYSIEDVGAELLGDPRVVHYLAKPYPVEDLVDVLARVGPQALGSA